MPQKSIKAVMDELTAMAQDKNTSPRAFADSFQAHSAELRAVFFPDTPMKMPEAHDDTEESSQECVTCFCEFLKEVRPQATHSTLEDYFRWNFDPGNVPFFMGEVGLSE